MAEWAVAAVVLAAVKAETPIQDIKHASAVLVVL
jgi:hypothetical protein